jgi:hypothetical protein
VVREAEVCRSGDVAAFGRLDDAAGGCHGGETFVERSGSHPASGAPIGEWLLLGGVGEAGGDAAPAIRMARSSSPERFHCEWNRRNNPVIAWRAAPKQSPA